MKLNFIVLLFSILALPLFAMGGKIADVPLKPSAGLAIADGEFLQYTQTIHGEKNLDVYFVTRFLSNRTAVIYQQGIRNPLKEKLPENYTNYSSHYLVSLDRAALMESVGNYNTNRSTENEPSGWKGEFYWHYLYNPANGAIEFEQKNWDGNEIKTKTFRMKSKPNYPHWDSISGSLFAVRFLDFSKPGIMLFVVPQVLKEPLPVSFRLMGKEKITTKAGTFNTMKVGLIAADPFLGQLMAPYAKDMLFWIEESDRRLIVKFQNPVSVMVLDTLSNVIRQQ